MYNFTKRIIDILISGITFLVFTPIFIVILVALRFSGEGEIFYFQKRIGYKNTYFQIWKFATMLKNSPNLGSGSITLRNDPRVTIVGKYLRMSKLNEFPQIINVLNGEMSIVGPRPLVDKTFSAYSPDVQSRVYNSKPGITGIGSIIFRDEESLISKSNMEPHAFYAEHIAPYKGALEMWYQDNKSTMVDLSLIFLTAWVILFSKSDMPHRLLKNLPPRPVELSIV